MYAAAVHGERIQIDANASQGLLKNWIDQGAGQLWIDLQAPTASDLNLIQSLFKLHPLAIEECDHTGVRPKIEQFEEHIFLVLHGINHNPGEDRLSTVEFKIFLWRNHLITVHDQASSSIHSTQERLRQNPNLLGRGGADTVLHHILDAVVDHYFPILEEFETQIENLESDIFHNPTESQLEEMLRLQRQVLTLHRLVHPQLDILGALSSGRFAEIEAGDVAYFRDVYDHLQRISDRIQLVREMLTGTMQCYLSQNSNRMNTVMKSLAVLATLALPMTFLTSLLGMNLEYIPGRSAPGTFWLIFGIAGALSVAILLLLRRLRWL